MSKNTFSKRSCKVLISLAVSIAIMVIIFRFSAQGSSESMSLSDRVAFLIASISIDGFAYMNPAEQLSWIEAFSWPVRKAAHATEYACLAISLVVFTWEAHCLMRERKHQAIEVSRQLRIDALIGFEIAVLYSCTDEIHQLFVDGRSGQASDVIVDAIGAAIGATICALVIYVHKKRGVSKTE